MNLIVVKMISCLALTIALLIMTFTSDEISNSKFFASLGIITGVLANKFLSNFTTHKHEKH